MSYRTILVHLDPGPLCAARTRFAIGLAKAQEGHLVGLAPTGIAEFPINVDSAASLADYADIAWKTVRSRAEATVSTFRQTCERAAAPSFDAAIDESAPAPSLVRHAHEADLVVLSQADPFAPDHVAARAIVEEIVLHNPRPTLLVPYAGRFDTFGRIALVTWDGSREAARAVADALPLLHRSAQVHLVSWREGDDDEGSMRARLDAARQWLARHRIAATVHCEPLAGIGIADAIVSRAGDLSADLVVMGAYGHARWTERMLGGATRGLLASMTVPVLMSR